MTNVRTNSSIIEFAVDMLLVQLVELLKKQKHALARSVQKAQTPLPVKKDVRCVISLQRWVQISQC